MSSHQENRMHCFPINECEAMFPDTIILDTYDAMHALRHIGGLFGKHPEFADDIAQELIERMQDFRHAYNSVSRYVEEIHIGAHAEEEDGDIEPEFAPYIGQLAHEIYRQLRDIRAYYPDGHLAYHFHLPDRPTVMNDVMLTRTRELTYHERLSYADLLRQHSGRWI